MITRSIVIGSVGIGLGVISFVVYMLAVWYVYMESNTTMLTPDTSAVSESLHSELSKELHDTKNERLFVSGRFVTTDTFLNLFVMLDQIKRKTGATLTVDSVNAETAGAKNSLGTVRVVVVMQGSWDTVERALKALSLTPVPVSILSSEVTATDKSGLFDARVTLRVYMKPKEVKSVTP